MRLNITIKIVYSALFLVSILLTACGGGGGSTTVIDQTPSYSVGGTISGLIGSVVLQDNGSNNLTVSANGSFTFATKLASGNGYNVSVLTQPSGQTCNVSSGSGTILANVTNVALSCTNNSYSVGGSVAGLTGSVVLQDNGGDNLTVSAIGTFTFATPVSNSNTYSIAVLTQPTGQTCSVSTGTGTVSGSNVANVAVVCATNTYSVGGTVSGLTGGSLVLQDNNGDNLTVAANGTFAFATQVAFGSPYSVTVLTHPIGQSCSVASGTGMIAAANVSNVTISCAATYTIGGAVMGLNGSMVLQNNGGVNLTVSTNGAFTFATTLANGNTYSVTQLSLQYPNQTCNITGGSGTVTANVTSVMINCAKNTIPRYVLAINGSDNSVSTYVVDNTTGRLKYISKSATGTAPDFVTVDPSGKYVYVANFSSNDVSQYTVGANGSLTPMTTATVVAGTGPVSITIDPSGKYAYVVNQTSATVSQYSIGTTGALTPMTAATVAAGSAPRFVAVAPSGKYAYVANLNSDNVSQYSISATGALIPMTPATVAAGTTPDSITIDPSGKYAYVTNMNSTNVSQYSIGATGALAPMSPATVAAGAAPTSIAIDPSGKYAYVANFGSDNVSQYSISATGALAAMAPATVVAGTGSSVVTVDPSGKYVYVANQTSANVSQYSVGATGVLTAMSPATMAGIGTITGPIAVVSGAQPVQAVPKYAYVANTTSNDVSAYSIETSTGALTSIGTPVATGRSPSSVTVDPTGKFAYVTNSFNGVGGNSISQFAITANGTLSPMNPATVAAGTQPMSITIDPSGRYAYVANSGSTTVSQYTIGASGALTPMVPATITTGGVIPGSPYSITVDPSGRYVYTSNTLFTISQYTIGSNGALALMASPTVAIMGDQKSITVDPSGRYVYLANGLSGGISQYTIGGVGALTPMTPATIAGGTLTFSVTVDPSGRYVYVADGGSINIFQYTISAGGVLTPMTPATVAITSMAALLTVGSVTVDSSGQYVYVADSENLLQYFIGAGGTLSPMTTATVAAGSGPRAVITTGTWQ